MCQAPTDRLCWIAGHALFSPGVSNALTWLFLGALAAATATQLWLAKRQILHVRAHRDAVPRMFAEAISLNAHQKAADYTVAKTQMGMLEIVLGAFALLALTLGGWIDWLGAQWTRFFEPQSLAHGVALCTSVAVLLAALELPFSIYRPFRHRGPFRLQPHDTQTFYPGPPEGGHARGSVRHSALCFLCCG